MSGVHSETLSEPRVARVRLNTNTLRTYAIPTGISPRSTARIAHPLMRILLIDHTGLKFQYAKIKEVARQVKCGFQRSKRITAKLETNFMHTYFQLGFSCSS